jgi:hypothetical protein
VGAISVSIVGPPHFPWLLFLVMWIAGSCFIYWFARRLKKVSCTQTSFIISNYRREIVVPFTEVESITSNRWINPQTVEISFKRDLGFGTAAVFIPQARFLWRAPHGGRVAPVDSQFL